MTLPGAYILLVTPTVHETTLIITGLSAYYVLQQKTKGYPYVKNMLFLIHVFFMGVVLFEFLRDFIVTPVFMQIYTVFADSFILWDVALMMTIAAIVYFRPPAMGIRKMLTSLLSKQPFGILYAAYILYIAVVDGYVIFLAPYSIVQLRDLLGAQVTSTAFNSTYLIMILFVLIIFMIFPTGLMLLAARKLTNPGAKRAMIILPISWVCIGAELLVFNGYFIAEGIDASAFGYLIAAGAFVVTAAAFRRASVLASFFELAPVSRAVTTEVAPFSITIGLDKAAVREKNYLLEVDPASNYEAAPRDFATELISNGLGLFVFTSRGSPVYAALERVPEAKFFIMTSRVSYPRGTEKPAEVLVPMNDLAVLLDVIDKTITSNPETRIGIIFDTLSDMIVSTGFESTFKFLKQASEILSNGKATSMFLLTSGAHDEKVERLIKNLFAVQLVYSTTGLAVAKKV